MTGFSDDYAYLQCDNPMPKSFLEPGSDFQIYTAPENGKINEKDQNKEINRIENERDKTKNDILNAFKDQHKDLKNGNNRNKWLDEKFNIV